MNAKFKPSDDLAMPSQTHERKRNQWEVIRRCAMETIKTSLFRNMTLISEIGHLMIICLTFTTESQFKSPNAFGTFA